MASRADQAQQPVPAVEAISVEDIAGRLESAGRAPDRDWLREVYEYAKEQHGDQKRKSGEPYITHPLAVAYLLADLKFDQDSVAVGLLHDVLEDTGVSKDALKERFGEEIADLVDGVSKIGKHAYVRRDDAQAETFRKLVLASAQDIRVIVVKLVDRLHNMQTLTHMPKEKQRRIARETLEIYAPIAHRLGMSRIKHELEDLAFFYLYPLQFADLQRELREKEKVGEIATERIRNQLEEALRGAGIPGDISYRTKSYYSIYQKLKRQGIDISELYDYLAFRIVTPELKDTYAALGVVHQAWRPIPGRIKDYIAVPKPNLYQSLHTTVVGERGQPFEVQIRTQEMDRVAEEGIAAHWRYKEGKLEEGGSDQDILWLRHLLEWQKEVTDPSTFLHTLKIDLYPDEVYVFTPKGDVLSFPRGATPLDFAYRVHTDLGHHCSGSRVSGRLVPLRTPLSNGDIVEILTNPNREPSRDWLKLVTTPRAKGKIRAWLNAQQRKRAVEIGRNLLERELKRYRSSMRKIADSDELEALLKDEGLGSLEDLCSKIGFGKAQAKYVTRRLIPAKELERGEEEPSAFARVVKRILPSSDSPVLVRGSDDMLAFLAKCCNPLPGDDIVGYITRGRGVSVHATECPNVRNLLYHPEREIDVEWARGEESSYEISLTIEADDSPGVLAKVTEAIAKNESNIRLIQADAGAKDSSIATVTVVVQVRNRKHLQKLQKTLAALDGIHNVRREMAGEGVPAGAG